MKTGSSDVSHFNNEKQKDLVEFGHATMCLSANLYSKYIYFYYHKL